MFARGPSVLAPLAAALFLFGCGDSPSGPDPGDVVAGVDLDVLFAAPTSTERTQVEGDWDSRSPVAEGLAEEGERAAELGDVPVRIRIVSHLVDGHRHYGLIVEPQEAPSHPVPILMYAHGGEDGVSLGELLLVASALELSGNDFVLAAPAFRSEPVRVGEESWLSDGPASPWDRDVDDALALLEVVLATVSFADPDRLGVVGLSRGGAVALLMAIREPRIRGVVSFFAPTDFFGPFVRGVFRETLLGRPPSLPGVGFLAREIIAPLLEGTMDESRVRLELLRRSSARFAERLPAVQVHHGTADGIVPVEEAEQLIAAMELLGRGPPDFQAFIYPGAGHSPFQMPESAERTRAFLEGVLGETSGGSGSSRTWSSGFHRTGRHENASPLSRPYPRQSP
jgi:dipeptidyl aminopeptidase/acylaminoacyl peptidase